MSIKMKLIADEVAPLIIAKYSEEKIMEKKEDALENFEADDEDEVEDGRDQDVELDEIDATENIGQF